MPRVTFLMPVYNGGVFLEEAVASMLAQTYQDFEILIIDDGSTDGSSERLAAMTDPRIRHERNATNIGLAASLNRGMSLCESTFVARMDCDDRCDPRRLEWQVAYMTQHPDCGMSGTWLRTFGAWHERTLIRYAETMPDIRANMLFGSPVAHPTLIFRKAMWDAAGLYYDSSFSRTEDFDLCVRAAERFEIRNLQRCTYAYRRHADCATRAHVEQMQEQVLAIIRRQVTALGLTPSDDVLELHCRANLGRRLASLDELADVEAWFRQLATTAGETAHAAPESLARAISQAWFVLCSNSAPLGRECLRRYQTSPLARAYRPPPLGYARFIASMVWHALKGTA